MKPVIAIALAALLGGCGSSVELDAPETTGRIEQPIWERGPVESSDDGARALVCIPLNDGCLRLSVIVNSLDRVDERVSGELVGHGCSSDSAPTALVDTFHGFVSTGHGTLWLEGDTILDDGTPLDLEVEAQLGDCR